MLYVTRIVRIANFFHDSYSWKAKKMNVIPQNNTIRSDIEKELVKWYG
jgi:hypothetical protein